MSKCVKDLQTNIGSTIARIELGRTMKSSGCEVVKKHKYCDCLVLDWEAIGENLSLVMCLHCHESSST